MTCLELLAAGCRHGPSDGTGGIAPTPFYAGSGEVDVNLLPVSCGLQVFVGNEVSDVGVRVDASFLDCLWSRVFECQHGLVLSKVFVEAAQRHVGHRSIDGDVVFEGCCLVGHYRTALVKLFASLQIVGIACVEVSLSLQSFVG